LSGNSSFAKMTNPSDKYMKCPGYDVRSTLGSSDKATNTKEKFDNVL